MQKGKQSSACSFPRSLPPQYLPEYNLDPVMYVKAKALLGPLLLIGSDRAAGAIGSGYCKLEPLQRWMGAGGRPSPTLCVLWSEHA